MANCSKAKPAYKSRNVAKLLYDDVYMKENEDHVFYLDAWFP